MLEGDGKIIFFSDGASGEAGALRRAYEIAGSLAVDLEVVAVVREVSTSDKRLEHNIRRIQKTIVQERTLELDSMIAALEPGSGPRVPLSRSVCIGRDYEEVIRKAVDDKAQLVIKSANSGQAIRNVLFGNTDIRLIHLSECPVMIFKPSRRKKISSVLVTIDPFAHSAGENDLNRQLLDTGAGIAGMSNAELHLLHVLESEVGDLGSDKSSSLEVAVKELEASLKSDAERHLTHMVSTIANVPVFDHVIKGKPHKVIAKFIEQKDIDLLVMGSVARSGVQGLLIGNTAERIINHIDCSVLVVKPEGWKSPIL